jgi:hypothetical protein
MDIRLLMYGHRRIFNARTFTRRNAKTKNVVIILGGGVIGGRTERARQKLFTYSVVPERQKRLTEKPVAVINAQIDR